MRICIVYHGGEFPPSERIEKVAQSLSSAGHEMFLLCNNYGNFERHEEQIGPIHTIRISPTLRSRKLNMILKFPVFMNPIWIAQLIATVKRYHIDALQVVDVPLSVAALWAGRAFGIPVVMDMWENYPEALRGWGRTNWKTRIFKNYRLARAVELWVTRRVDHVITVVEEQKERLIVDGVSPERISVVTNGLDEELFTAGELRDDTPMDEDLNSYKLFYVGGITPERGLEDIVRALKLVLRVQPDVLLYIAGTGPEEGPLRQLAAALGVSKAVRFLGWLPFRDIRSYVAKSDLCLVPHVNNDFINTTIPNKIFQYMWMSKPVLVSDAKPLARVVRESGGGFVFRSGDPEDAAAKILEAYHKRDDLSIGAHAHDHVLHNYLWRDCAAELLAIYRQLVNRKAKVEAGK